MLLLDDALRLWTIYFALINIYPTQLKSNIVCVGLYQAILMINFPLQLETSNFIIQFLTWQIVKPSNLSHGHTLNNISLSLNTKIEFGNQISTFLHHIVSLYFTYFFIFWKILSIFNTHTERGKMEKVLKKLTVVYST